LNLHNGPYQTALPAESWGYVLDGRKNLPGAAGLPSSPSRCFQQHGGGASIGTGRFMRDRSGCPAFPPGRPEHEPARPFRAAWVKKASRSLTQAKGSLV
jgi:hypothetical protein